MASEAKWITEARLFNDRGPIEDTEVVCVPSLNTELFDGVKLR